MSRSGAVHRSIVSPFSSTPCASPSRLADLPFCVLLLLVRLVVVIVHQLEAVHLGLGLELLLHGGLDDAQRVLVTLLAVLLLALQLRRFALQLGLFRRLCRAV